METPQDLDRFDPAVLDATAQQLQRTLVEVGAETWALATASSVCEVHDRLEQVGIGGAIKMADAERVAQKRRTFTSDVLSAQARIRDLLNSS